MNITDTVPIQYLEKRAFFLGMEIKVDPRVFIPRPETEVLVEAAASACQKNLRENPLILDVCTGSGAIGLGMVKLLGRCRVVGLDISHKALAVARENIRRFGRQRQIKLVRTDMFTGIRETVNSGLFDAIVSNPPYVSREDFQRLDDWVKQEPHEALYGGPEGMDYLNIVAGCCRGFLKRGGFAAVEIGYNQAEMVKESFYRSGFEEIRSYRDFNGYERVILGWNNG